ncbi:hypothetical protein AB0M28_10630 [Streptomyces sp. NPDC051940]|uniref:hypothetical protein n=1 Tax=Streptomyces sp. NPDC051940 TaxID=3155675 RepID=UPI0034187FFF
MLSVYFLITGVGISMASMVVFDRHTRSLTAPPQPVSTLPAPTPSASYRMPCATPH